MIFKRFISSVVLALLMAMASFQAAASQISAGAAQSVANNFIKCHSKAVPGSINAPALADIVLTHAEPSDKVVKANVYYIFNIKGGGFIIVSGDDHAAPVLGYSDKGHIDVGNMSESLQDMLGYYKAEIDYLLTHDTKASKPLKQNFREATTIVEPMTKSTWGPEEPYYNMCPMKGGVHSKVGCAGVSVAQMLYFWEFPFASDSLPRYWSSRLYAYVPALPATTFNYHKMLLSYSHWDFDLEAVVQDAYTDEQVEEVAKLCRYSGHFLKMNYSPDLSTPNVTGGKLAVMKTLGYNSNAVNVWRTDYDCDQWMAMLRADLDAGRPVMYTGYGASAASVGHGFIIDGYDNEDYFHMNFGWYGVNDGWFLIDSITFINRYHQEIFYQTKISMILGVEPPLFCIMNTEINADSGLHFLGETLNPRALDIDLSMSYRTLPFMFSLTDVHGNQVALSESVTINRLNIEQGSEISLPLTLPESLPNGTYDLNLNYRTSAGSPLTIVATAQGKLTVVGRFAKFGIPFGIDDVVAAIDYIVNGDSGVEVSIADVTALIDYLLEN